jgi:hypothetical protein
MKRSVRWQRAYYFLFDFFQARIDSSLVVSLDKQFHRFLSFTSIYTDPQPNCTMYNARNTGVTVWKKRLMMK